MPYPNGNQCVSIQFHSSISQNVSLIGGVNYILEFKGCGRPINNTSNIIFIELLKNSNLFLTIVSDLITPTIWTTYSYAFTLNETGLFTLRFRGISNTDRSTAFQNILLKTSE
jgi:hypothetical protein